MRSLFFCFVKLLLKIFESTNFQRHIVEQSMTYLFPYIIWNCKVLAENYEPYSYRRGLGGYFCPLPQKSLLTDILAWNLCQRMLKLNSKLMVCHCVWHKMHFQTGNFLSPVRNLKPRVVISYFAKNWQTLGPSPGRT